MFEEIKRSIGRVLIGDSLKARVFRGGAWLGAGTVVEHMLRFGRNILLARLLAPEAFGTMAVVLSVGSFVDTFAEIGLKEAIIQNPRGGENRYTNAAWWLLIGRATVLYSLILAITPSIAKLYGNPNLAPLLRVTLLSIWFYSLMSPRAYVAIKDMKLSKWATVQHGGGACGVVITIVLSFFIRNVWALVIGFSAESATRCILSHLMFPYRPSFKFDREVARDLLEFSRGMWGVTFLNLIFCRTDIFVLAKLYPAEKLGLYTMGVYLAQTPTFFLIGLLNQVLMPTYSQIQGDMVRINRIIHRVTYVLMVLGMPALVFVFFCGRSLLTIVYGERYGCAAAVLVVASCVAAINILNNQFTTVFYSNGSPQSHRTCIFIMAISTVFLIYPMVKWFGIVGGQVATLASIAVGYVFQIIRIRRLTGLDLSRYGKALLVSAALSISVAAVCLGTRPFAVLAEPIVAVGLGAAGCLVAYGLAYPLLLSNLKGAT